LTQNNRFIDQPATIAESTSVAKAHVVSGLGYPNGRPEKSESPVGWQGNEAEITTIEKQVSRETSR
jgi:hypothetical protein